MVRSGQRARLILTNIWEALPGRHVADAAGLRRREPEKQRSWTHPGGDAVRVARVLRGIRRPAVPFVDGLAAVLTSSAARA